jgi:predicted nucleic acid-binding protein
VNFSVNREGEVVLQRAKRKPASMSVGDRFAAPAWQHRLPILSRDQHFDLVPQLTRREW